MSLTTPTPFSADLASVAAAWIAGLQGLTLVTYVQLNSSLTLKPSLSCEVGYSVGLQAMVLGQTATNGSRLS